ncbi:vanillate O-demethylase monooxygenase subunit [Sphingobium xenophagum]|uniref:Vanillate O-demethylase monooxygenase subunit n=1 Tax=Sphingobium xenophagum TaxID=121428 RepID=A0ABU1X6L0_SPHXE|nr:aromatic ring-hydroxylating dioxygenase subunit alpha [Sphingobium xenophagum]MDR7157181.1 vanillate O-demethylase monooxygenase subunit [Sphingobium xenophagum]
MKFVRNAWYIAALSEELEGDALLARILLDEPVMVYRTKNGEIAAMSDRCPHRFAPLHKGQRVNDTVTCPYHGLMFDNQGTCIRSPHGDGTIPPLAHVRSYPARERYRMIWVWMGDAEVADDALIPDFGFIDEGPEDGLFVGRLHTKGNYLLMVDNILDLSHSDFLHPLLGTGEAVASQRPAIKETNRGFRISWEWSASKPMQFFQIGMPDVDLADGWIDIDWEPASAMKLHAGSTPSGAHRADGVSINAMHFMTPESEFKTHYFYAVRRDYMNADAEQNTLFATATRQAFATEDSPMIEAVQEYMGTSDLWSLKPAVLSSDIGGVRARRWIDKVIKAENEGVA